MLKVEQLLLHCNAILLGRVGQMDLDLLYLHENEGLASFECNAVLLGSVGHLDLDLLHLHKGEGLARFRVQCRSSWQSWVAGSLPASPAGGLSKFAIPFSCVDPPDLRHAVVDGLSWAADC